MTDLRFAVLTISDRSYAGERTDLSGPALLEEINQAGWQISRSDIVPDEYEQIRNILLQWCDEHIADVVLTTGGTGFSPRDITPEATKSILERETPGLCEAMRQASMAITPHAMLSRATAGIRGKTLIINLPGSPRAAVENFNVVKPVLKHAIDLLQNDPGAEQGHRTGPTTDNK